MDNLQDLVMVPKQVIVVACMIAIRLVLLMWEAHLVALEWVECPLLAMALTPCPTRQILVIVLIHLCIQAAVQVVGTYPIMALDHIIEIKVGGWTTFTKSRELQDRMQSTGQCDNSTHSRQENTSGQGKRSDLFNEVYDNTRSKRRQNGPTGKRYGQELASSESHGFSSVNVVDTCYHDKTELVINRPAHVTLVQLVVLVEFQLVNSKAEYKEEHTKDGSTSKKQ
eukprot:Gb_08286 [translate_table: standard]